ncbi:hypothetical protein HMPREF9080_01632 [Cardiobacterium valvarum F0432]|uniref:Uncharacterized protein n=1 Tax=Cardiobacterium valvarum F0432 TaxID=797473 RepID=G9ZFT4_9GAMM|nr:hypothetical protein HMPREF9080_01632 [Cardiobacterium valvarum F0432]
MHADKSIAGEKQQVAAATVGFQDAAAMQLHAMRRVFEAERAVGGIIGMAGLFRIVIWVIAGVNIRNGIGFVIAVLPAQGGFPLLVQGAQVGQKGGERWLCAGGMFHRIARVIRRRDGLGSGCGAKQQAGKQAFHMGQSSLGSVFVLPASLFVYQWATVEWTLFVHVACNN